MLFSMRARLAPFAAAALAAFAGAQDWPSYGGDPGGMKYSPLHQINRSNVAQLRPVWVFHTGEVSDGTKWPTRSGFETTPLVIGERMYITTPFSRVIALEAETGREIWAFDPRIDRNESTNLFVNRGAAYWADGRKARVFLGTIDGRLFSIDAQTGRPDDSFGLGGWIDLRPPMPASFIDKHYGMTSPPAIYRNLVICGSLVPDGEPHGPAGDVRAFDANTGKLVWTFHTVARKGEPGNDTWADNSWRDRGGVNAWPPLSVDEKRGIVFLPLTSPATDFYGGDRKGTGLFGDSLVALDAATGREIWHFQTVHHNLWDYDLPAQPTLVTVLSEGKLVDAVAQVTKTGFTFLFERTTGKPLFPIEEVATPASEVPGEAAWQTQPRPLKPPPYARQRMSAEELTDVTPESRAYCQKLMDGAVLAPVFTPIGLRPTILFPGTNGGANWGGASFDPETHTLYVNSMDVGMVYHMARRPPGSEIPWRPAGSGSPNSRFWDHDLNPCQRPPWGFLTSIDLDRGEFRWRAVLGVVDDLVKRGLPPTGAPNIGGSLATAGGLVFIGASNDSRFRGFDKDTGKELWVARLPASGHATPMTFRGKSGRQFVVIAAGGGNKYSKTFSDALIAFALADGANGEPRVSYSRAIAREAPRESTAAQTAGPVPEPFSHSRHAALKLRCRYCHQTASTAARAEFPEASVCRSCHSNLAIGPAERVKPVSPVYRLPDFVVFSHARHAAARIECAACHGDVWKQDRIAPVLQMKMKACVDCHRATSANVSCTACHELSQ